MIELGYYSLILAWVMTLYSLGALLWSARKSTPLLTSGYRAIEASFVLIATASVGLVVSLIRHDFRLEYVASYTSRELPLVYVVTAFWGGQSGSLLLWTLLLAFFGVVVLLQYRRRQAQMLPFVSATIAGVQLFFLSLMIYAANPFRTLAAVPRDGRGLNPLLQNFFMVIHPPFLYLGFVAFTVPFAFAVASLALGRSDTEWIRVSRRWSLTSWLFLTAGILLGAYWAYIELGWGGYWAWDPVENASLMPWLTATAFLHSVMVQEKQGMLKRWNLALIIATFELCIFGTFLTRSGIVSSVHAFADSHLGPLFLVFLGSTTLLCLVLLLRRRGETRSTGQIQSLISRESVSLFNNLLFVAITVAVLWGTMFPAISEILGGDKITVTASFFNRVSWPLALAVLVLIGLCPAVGWRRNSFRELGRRLTGPVLIGLAAGIAVWAVGVRRPVALAFFFGSGVVITTAALEFFRGSQVRRRLTGESFLPALRGTVRGNTRHYGGVIVHLGVAVALAGIVGSSFFSHEHELTLKPGRVVPFSGYQAELLQLEQRRDSNKDVVYARIRLSRGGALLGEIQPEKHFHRNSEQPQTEVAICSTLREDVYLVLMGWEADGTVILKANVNPVVSLLWLGGVLILLGTLYALLPNSRPGTPAQTTREAEA